MRMAQALVVLCLAVQVAMAGVSVASSPWEVLFTVCWVVFAFVTTAMVISVAWILVVYPMWSIHRAVSVRTLVHLSDTSTCTARLHRRAKPS